MNASSPSGRTMPFGSAVLSGGAAVVSGLDIPSGAIVLVSRGSSGAGVLNVTSITGVSFAIGSSNGADAGTALWAVVG